MWRLGFPVTSSSLSLVGRSPEEELRAPLTSQRRGLFRRKKADPCFRHGGCCCCDCDSSKISTLATTTTTTLPMSAMNKPMEPIFNKIPSNDANGPNHKWDRRFLALANHVSQWSKDPSTKVGCIIVGSDREIRSTGFNGFPRGIEDDERLTIREQKYPIVCHAEENAIMHAARIGVSLKGCIAYVTWPPCTRCARGLIQAGVEEVVFPAEASIPERWMADFDISTGMMREAGVGFRSA